LKVGVFMAMSEVDISPQEYIYMAIHMLANRLQILGDRFDPTISSKQWHVLAVISKFEKKQPNIGDIANVLGTSRQNIKKIANILQQRGFIRMEKDKNDMRNILLYLTEQCEAYYKGREQMEREYLESIFSGLDDDELKNIKSGMTKLLTNIENLLEEDRNRHETGI